MRICHLISSIDKGGAETHLYSLVKKQIQNKNSIIIIYGGSVNPKNVNKLSSIKGIDGFLIGGASQSGKKFIDIIKNCYM